MMDAIQAYVRSKGVETNKTGWNALREQLLNEYGRLAPVVKNCSHAEVITLPIQTIVYFEKFVNSIEGRVPVSSNGSNGIVGLVVKMGNKYRLIDGNHRFKYCLDNNVQEANFIIVT